MTDLITDIEGRLLAYLRDDVSCEPLEDRDGRLGVLTPLEYPNGDNVTVWVQARDGIDGLLRVSDYGEATSEAVLSGHAPAALRRVGVSLANGRGLSYVDDRISVECVLDEIGEYVWRVASVAAQLTAAALTTRKQRVYKIAPARKHFSTEVEYALLTRDIQVTKGRHVEGRSGHVYKIPLFVPESESILEPLHATEVQAPEVASAYLKFGDLRNTNGYRLFSVLDDRDAKPDDEVGRLLTQVSTVVRWSRLEEWLSNLS